MAGGAQQHAAVQYTPSAPITGYLAPGHPGQHAAYVNPLRKGPNPCPAQLCLPQVTLWGGSERMPSSRRRDQALPAPTHLRPASLIRICPRYLLKSFACLPNRSPFLFLISVCPPDRARAGSGWTRWLTCCGWRLRAPSRPRPASLPPLAPTVSTSAWSACAAWVRPPAAQGRRGPNCVPPSYIVWLYGCCIVFVCFPPPPPSCKTQLLLCVRPHGGACQTGCDSHAPVTSSTPSPAGRAASC